MQSGAQRTRESASRIDPGGKWLTASLATTPAPDSADELQTPSDSNGHENSLVELPPHGCLPRLDLGIEWPSPHQEFWTSVGALFSRQRAPKDDELPADADLRVHWVGGKNSGWAFAASTVWHVIAVLLLVLPIWGFLPATARNLAPVQIEVNWTAQDLPPISLATPKLAAPSAKPKQMPLPEAAKQPPIQNGADAFQPRQTILSIPVRVTHPRQTLIQPSAPMTPPKVEPELPNIVQWASSAAPPKPQLQFSPSASAPKMRQRATSEAIAPEVANLEKNSGPINIASSSTANPQLQMPVTPMSAAVAQPRRARADANTAAPEVGGASGDSSLRDVIALSATPASPAPELEVPQGNLAARVAISPEGAKRGLPGGTGTSESGSNNAGTGSGNGSAAGGVGNGGPGSLPAAISISEGSGHATTSGGGGLAGSQTHTKLILKPMHSPPEKPEPMNSRKGPANVAALGVNDPPEKILSGKEVYKLNVTSPNVTSSSGSWILNFAQLDETASPFNKPKGVLSGPVPVSEVDPKYPPETIKENIEGEVVLYAIIRADGSVDSIQLVRKLDPRLDNNAIQALAQWKFRPAMRDGSPIDIEAVVHIPFRYHPPQQ